MIRAPWGDADYWKKWTDFDIKTINEFEAQLKLPSSNPSYRPQYVWNLAIDYGRLILREYSKGVAVKNLDASFACLLYAWELSNRLSGEVCRANDLKSCRDWTFELSDINHYNWCFWLVGLALALNISDVEWQRLLALIDAEGQDELLDRVIASRQKNRSIGVGIIHQKPYARLLRAVKGSKEDRPKLLREFLDNWYLELARKGRDELWWYAYGDPIKSPLEKGSYFGRWCVEAAIAAKVFVIDDKYCLGHDYYPGDLLRPNGPSTHRDRAPVAQGFLSKIWRKLN